MAEQTIPHKLISLIYKKGEVDVEEAAKILKLDKRVVIDFAKILREPNIIEIFYAVSGGISLKPGREFKRALEDSVAMEEPALRVRKFEPKAAEEKQYIDDFLTTVRKRITEKKRSGNGTGKDNTPPKSPSP